MKTSSIDTEIPDLFKASAFKFLTYVTTTGVNGLVRLGPVFGNFGTENRSNQFVQIGNNL